MFRRRERPEELVNKIDMMIATLSKQSKFLKDQYSICYKQAERLAREGIEDASKKWLAMALVCKKMRSNIESQIADLFASRMQLLVSPPEEMSTIMAKVNEMLIEAERTREATERTVGQLVDITRLRVEASTGAEYYGVSSEEVDEAFREMCEKAGLKVAAEEAPALELPEVPTKAAAQREAEKEKEEARTES